jgi:hypothetical protein
MSSAQRLSLYLIVGILGILGACNCISTPWISWNEAISANNGVPVNTFTIPNAPHLWKRNFGVDQINSNYTNRSNQYLNYYAVKNIGNCLVYCGPRSFLIVDSNGLYICQRDTTSNYWGGISNVYGDSYSQYCIPNVPNANSAACGYTNISSNLQASCNSGNIPSPYLNVYYSCCYENAYQSNNRGYVLYD